MHKDRWQDVDRCIDRQSPQVSLWHEGEEIRGTPPARVKEGTRRLPTKVGVPSASEAQQVPGWNRALVVARQLLQHQPCCYEV